jgi:hypothetical protein
MGMSGSLGQSLRPFCETLALPPIVDIARLPWGKGCAFILGRMPRPLPGPATPTKGPPGLPQAPADIAILMGLVLHAQRFG